MRQRRFDQFTQMFLVNASQMAYLEEASGTQAMLQKFIELFRYFNKPDKQINLADEMDVLKKYIELQKIRYGNRFEVTIADYDDTGEITVNHLSIIDFFDNILNDALAQYEKTIHFHIEIIFAENVSLKVTLKADMETEEFNRTLMEEVDSDV